MPAKVRDWMSSPVIVVDADSSVKYALTLMRRRRIHSLVVTLETENQYGILTTTDIRDKIMASNTNPVETRVRDIMTAPVHCAHPEWSLQECSIKMQEYRIHHMPVADDSGALIGIISATDIFTAAEEIGWGSGG